MNVLYFQDLKAKRDVRLAQRTEEEQKRVADETLKVKQREQQERQKKLEKV